MIITITVPAVPVGQPRARAVGTPNGRARMHEVTSVKKADGTRQMHPIVAFKATVRTAFQAAYQGAPLEGPLRVDVTAVFPRTKNLIWKTKPMPRLWHTAKPDRDNVDKAVMDALKSLAWIDDSQASAGQIRKYIAAGDEQPHVTISIETLGPLESVKTTGGLFDVTD